VHTRAVTVPLFPFSVQFRSVFGKKKRGINFSVSVFPYTKTSIALHITFVQNEPITLHRTIHQMDNIVMFVCKLAVYVMQLLHIKTQKVNLLHFSM